MWEFKDKLKTIFVGSIPTGFGLWLILNKPEFLLGMTYGALFAVVSILVGMIIRGEF